MVQEYASNKAKPRKRTKVSAGVQLGLACSLHPLLIRSELLHETLIRFGNGSLLLNMCQDQSQGHARF